MRDIKDLFELFLKEANHSRNIEQWIIIYDSKWIRLPSGKLIWEQPTFAMSALTNAFQGILCQIKADWQEQAKLIKEFKKWRETNIQIVRLGDWIKSANV